jgi:DNA polymerase-1
LIEGKESARLSRKLARIVTDVPIKLNLKACQVHDYDRGKAIALFQRLEFRSLIKKLPRSENEEEPKVKDKNKQMKLL